MKRLGNGELPSIHGGECENGGTKVDSTTFCSPPLVDRSSSALFRLLPLPSSSPRGGRNQAHRQTSNSKRPAAGLEKRQSSGSAGE
ncbi:unnamed protein product [Linum trigynum]|uniref:Uncharacterized protein n=1 Tax=Linum trigynum TaxID=586398 RepID=A0AAV2CW59_9ROSI